MCVIIIRGRGKQKNRQGEEKFTHTSVVEHVIRREFLPQRSFSRLFDLLRPVAPFLREKAIF